ncbi:serine protease Do [Peribacillus deserti]|uniref:Serine protease Do n=1 Tax=Peribacillus deserti TaxID=673318 RepID=A0ABS2QLE7_9BACI|nr:trypsin-like peptidase domain-containing protein [Peribacillus deserti]MBM7693544.1 serine protease Do [Peribacillus deserti]
MGYYDQDYQRSTSRGGSRRGYFFSGLIGAIIGALIISFALPSFNSEKSDVADTNTNNGDQSKLKQSVSLNVNTAVTEAVDKAGDAVVGITNIQQSGFLEEEGGQAGTGSGVLYKKSGDKAYIVTNHHVVENASKLEISLSNGTKIPAKLQGSDIWTDLAVLSVDAEKVKTVAEFGDSEALKAGEPVLAIGNPLGLQFSGSVTQGVISGLERTIEIDVNQDGTVDWNSEVLQTDAAINPGNSGGALVNLAGQVIGINSMKIAQQAVEGIGLSIPINTAIPVIEDLERYGEVRRPYMGVELRSVEEISQYHQQNTLKLPRDVTSGVAIVQVEQGSPADKAGIKEFDVIVEMDGEKIKDVAELRQHLFGKKKIGQSMKIKLYRDGKQQEVSMNLSSNDTF